MAHFHANNWRQGRIRTKGGDQEVRAPPLLLAGFAFGLACNGALLAQIAWYGMVVEGQSLAAVLTSDFATRVWAYELLQLSGDCTSSSAAGGTGGRRCICDLPGVVGVASAAVFTTM